MLIDVLWGYKTALDTPPNDRLSLLDCSRYNVNNVKLTQVSGATQQLPVHVR